MGEAKRVAPWALAAAAALLVVLAPPTVRALGNNQGSLLGSYRLAGPQADADARIRRAIDAVVSDVTPLLQTPTRSRLTATNTSSLNLTIEESGEWVTIRYDHARYVTRVGTWHTVHARGEQVRLLTQVRRPHLYQTFVGHDGRKVITLTAQAQSLWMDVSASGSQLPRPVRYRLEYRRL